MVRLVLRRLTRWFRYGLAGFVIEKLVLRWKLAQAEDYTPVWHNLQAELQGVRDIELFFTAGSWNIYLETPPGHVDRFAETTFQDWRPENGHVVMAKKTRMETRKALNESCRLRNQFWLSIAAVLISLTSLATTAYNTYIEISDRLSALESASGAGQRQGAVGELPPKQEPLVESKDENKLK